jgi:hypothetical protein
MAVIASGAKQSVGVMKWSLKPFRLLVEKISKEVEINADAIF